MTRMTPLGAVTIENFRGVRKLRLALHPQVTVLFGANAAGKTTILDAIAIGLGAYVSRVPKATGRGFAKAGDLRVPMLDRRAVDEQRGIERPFAHVEVQSASGLQWGVTHWRSAADRSAQARNVLAHGGGRSGPRDLHAWVDPLVREALDSAPGKDTTPLPLVAAYGNERAVVDLPLRERGFRHEFDRLGALDQSLSATTRFKTVFEWFRVAEDEERREQTKKRDFKYRLPELEWIRRAVGLAQLHCSNPRVETKPIRMLVDFEHDQGMSETLDLSSLSDGYRTHFALVVDVARRMVQLNPSANLKDPERGTNSPAVILIDEVDLHLDPPWQARVVGGLRAAFPNAQFVLTTHSEQVVGSVEAASVRKLLWSDGEIVVEEVPYAQGTTGERILIDLMGAPERAPGPVTEKLTAYVQMVDRGEGGTEQAKALRAELDRNLPGDERLHQADLEMQKQALLGQLRSAQP